ncbi:hypothetical protein HHK36_018961 [Tetracentron sinense]|uniref:Protein kinase domain-containing protein n=1 Tax=Tetracentron sinense TaxID=13715 RepID=A0A834YVC8_TETSI|nr:hypothetical protein HHK36_018961 [Tetracentron sinense]
METRLLLWFLSSFLLFFDTAMATMFGFVSLDCGGKENFTDDIGLEWTPDDQLMHGETATISVANETRKQYMTVRHFPADKRKYCYRLDVITRTRYLVRATFLYGNFDNSNVYPKFDISIDTTHWSTITISDANPMEVRELIILASNPTLNVCLSNAIAGNPFISTIELRQFNGSMYYTNFENQFFLSVSARINFGADSDAPVRYPDDPFDRIWESDSFKKANRLVDVAPGTEKVSTRMPIHVHEECPPQKVMQTAVVGRNGSLTYRLVLYGFPGFGWAYAYLAEIENLSPNETRIFNLLISENSYISKFEVNIQENAPGKNRLYKSGVENISLPLLFSFKVQKTKDSSVGPLLNAMEINKYVKKNDGSLDGAVIANLVSQYPSADWAREGGDPCLPVSWSWVECNSDPQPRIVSIFLSGKNLTGNIPSEITQLTGLIEIHLENNRLTGDLPSSLMDLQHLRKLYLQNNMLSGTIPGGLLNKNLVLNYSGNANLHEGGRGGSHMKIIIGSSVGAALLLIIVSYLFLHKGKKRSYEEDPKPGCFSSQFVSDQITSVLPAQRLVSPLRDAATESAHCFSLSEIESATRKFEKEIGLGGFGVVYYGKMKDGKEIAVKVLTNNSDQGNQEFSNEVTFQLNLFLYSSIFLYLSL